VPLQASTWHPTVMHGIAKSVIVPL
jgi:hypothetical protein